MSAHDRKVKRRDGIRCFFKSTLASIEDYLKEESLDQAKLRGHKKTLSSIVDQLSKADDDVSKSLEPDAVAADVVESMAFIAPANELEAILDLKLSEMNTVKELAPSSIGSSSSNACRLPKMEISVFSGDPLMWQGFWDQFQVSIHENE